MKWQPASAKERPFRIGPCMLAATEYVAAHPGCTKYAPALAVAPRGPAYRSQSPGVKYGYRSVNRAIRAGLIEARKLSRGWELFVTEKGTRELEMKP